MMNSLLDTEPQRMMDYSHTGVNECPACGSDLIEADGVKFPTSARLAEVWRKSNCLMCLATWHEVYQLVDIQDLSADTQALDSVPLP